MVTSKIIIKLGLILLLVLSGCGVLKSDDIPSGWLVKSDTVSLFITEQGGQMAPVYFYNDTAEPVQPYYISPWQKDKSDEPLAPVLTLLRGDFFCMPYGANAQPYQDEIHPAHGEVACSCWSLADRTIDNDIITLTLTLDTKIRRGRVTKKIYLVEGQNVVYSTHIIEGITGNMPVGHHCILDIPEEENSLQVVVSKFEFGRTNPVLFADPAHGAYQSMAVDAIFNDLRQVPVMTGEAATADCTSLPHSAGLYGLVADFQATFRRTGLDRRRLSPSWLPVVLIERRRCFAGDGVLDRQ